MTTLSEMSREEILARLEDDQLLDFRNVLVTADLRIANIDDYPYDTDFVIAEIIDLIGPVHPGLVYTLP